jgi:hypothetical protein
MEQLRVASNPPCTEKAMGWSPLKPRRPRYLFSILAFGALILWGSAANGQGTGGASGSESGVGYIDPAFIGNVIRERFDAADNFHQPSRAEFFYAQARPGGPGLPMPEARVNYQEILSYVEVAPVEGFSTFVEIPVRFLQQQINPNANGLGDMNFGIKYMLGATEDRVTTFQLRTYVPTGNATLGLGNNHVSFEPALLHYQRLSEKCNLESELRYWVPVGGTDFAGDIIRYGVGLSYSLCQTDRCQFLPVAEFVGWTVLGGKASTVEPNAVVVKDAAGQTIVNAKLGLRVKVRDLGDFYVGYGRPLTGDRWYENTVRAEFRIGF